MCRPAAVAIVLRRAAAVLEPAAATIRTFCATRDNSFRQQYSIQKLTIKKRHLPAYWLIEAVMSYVVGTDGTHCCIPR